MSMIDDQMRIAIAEACGWLCNRVPREVGEVFTIPERWVTHIPLRDGAVLVCGDPLDDLNAMHEAEKVLNPDQIIGYDAALRDIILSELEVTHNGEWYWHATARQRAEAFLLTIGTEAD